MLRCMSISMLRSSTTRCYPRARLASRYHELCHALHDPDHARIHHQSRTFVHVRDDHWCFCRLGWQTRTIRSTAHRNRNSQRTETHWFQLWVESWAREKDRHDYLLSACSSRSIDDHRTWCRRISSARLRCCRLPALRWCTRLFRILKQNQIRDKRENKYFLRRTNRIILIFTGLYFPFFVNVYSLVHVCVRARTHWFPFISQYLWRWYSRIPFVFSSSSFFPFYLLMSFYIFPFRQNKAKMNL